MKPTMKPYFLQTDVTRACEEQTILTGKTVEIPNLEDATWFLSSKPAVIVKNRTRMQRGIEQILALPEKDYLIPYIRAALDLSRQCFAEVAY